MTMEKGLAFMVRKYQLEHQDEGGRGLGRSEEVEIISLLSLEQVIRNFRTVFSNKSG